ncbi:MAG: DUF4097 family beta strand repeat-containing protein [Eubacteriales bacterium]|nr:DUF4097 family beta strand repeat-containing protein [Eubacteriales bacterium]
MNRTEFMDRLEKALHDVPEDERRRAMDYYAHYFDEAESEQQAVDALGAPEKVAADILRDFQDTAEAQTMQKSKKRRRKYWIAGIVAVTAICIGVFAAHHSISGKQEILQTKQLQIEEEIHILTVEAESAQVFLQVGDNWRLDAGDSTTWDVQDSLLSIRQKDPTGLFQRKPGYILITVPPGELNTLNLSIAAGNLEMKHMTVPYTITCYMGMGSAYMEDVVTEQLALHVATGSAYGEDVNAGELALSAEDGKIVWDGNVYESADVNCDAGSIDLLLQEDSEIGSIAGTAGDGTVVAQVNGTSFLDAINLANGFSYTLQWMNKTGELHVKCNTGDIVIQLKTTEEVPYT